ncbi:MAG: M67 family metallopeptidase [Ruminococcus sp.]|nr:M67 family metallopeptidase [Ruminococcus sp.]
MIFIKRLDFEKMTAYAKQLLPEEACGLIAGREVGEDVWIEKVYLLPNAEHSRVHFTIEPKAQFAAVKDIRRQERKLLGNWHSHPESAAIPSLEDRRLAYDITAHYLILSLQGETPVLRSFHIENMEWVAELLVITS